MFSWLVRVWRLVFDKSFGHNVKSNSSKPSSSQYFLQRRHSSYYRVILSHSTTKMIVFVKISWLLTKNKMSSSPTMLEIRCWTNVSPRKFILFLSLLVWAYWWLSKSHDFVNSTQWNSTTYKTRHFQKWFQALCKESGRLLSSKFVFNASRRECSALYRSSPPFSTFLVAWTVQREFSIRCMIIHSTILRMNTLLSRVPAVDTFMLLKKWQKFNIMSSSYTW